MLASSKSLKTLRWAWRYFISSTAPSILTVSAGEHPPSRYWFAAISVAFTDCLNSEGTSSGARLDAGKVLRAGT